jgi:DNA-binding response OmpR family regulator
MCVTSPTPAVFNFQEYIVSQYGSQILIVDDEPAVRKLLRRCLEKEGFTVHEAADGAGMNAALQQHNINLVTLDITLDGEDGLDLARELRANNPVPIIMVSGKGDLIDTVVGLEVGADDYISKPFELREVVARIRAVLRRYNTAGTQQADSTAQQASENNNTDTYHFANWTLNSTTRELYDANNKSVALTTGEFDLLLLFVTSPRRVLSRDQIMDLLKGNEWLPNDRTIDNQVARLRKKLVGDDNKPSTLIKTIRGTGYLFTPEVNS